MCVVRLLMSQTMQTPNPMGPEIERPPPGNPDAVPPSEVPEIDVPETPKPEPETVPRPRSPKVPEMDVPEAPGPEIRTPEVEPHHMPMEMPPVHPKR